MTMVEITLFGVLAVGRGDGATVAFQGRRGRDLLAYLALHRETAHTREQLAALFWGDLDDRKARHCLNTALWRLHQDLAAAGIPPSALLRADAETVGFNGAGAGRLDVAEFEARCAWAAGLPSGPGQDERRAALYAQAAALYRGELLVECYEDWCLLERERLGLLQLRALGWLLGHHAGRGEHEAALGYGRRILAADPLREEVHRAVIGVQLAAGQPAAALRQYRQCEEVVRRELGTEPLPETRALLPLLLGADRAPGGERAAGPMSAARTGPDLSAALASLREAADLAERMGAYLRDATALLERVIARDGQDAPAAIEPLLADRPPGKPALSRVLTLLADASQTLTPSHAPERARGSPRIPA